MNITTAYYLFGLLVIARFLIEFIRTINKTSEDELRRREENELRLSKFRQGIKNDESDFGLSNFPFFRLLILIWVIAGFFTPYRLSFISIFAFSIIFQPMAENIPPAHAYPFYRCMKFASIIHIAGTLYLHFYIDKLA